MTNQTLHPAPRGRDVLLEQVRIVGLGLRREAVVAAIVFGIVTLVIGADIVRGHAETWFDSDDWLPIGIAASLFPFAVWRRDARFGPAFLWTLPVDRRRLALARVFAGWVWLIAALGILVLWQNALALLSGVASPETVPLMALSGATALYLLGSALVLGLRHPARWLLGSVGVIFLLRLLNAALGLGPDGRTEAFLRSIGFFSVIDAVETTAQTLAPPARSAYLTFLWIGAGLAVLLPALSRHRERRRR